MSPQAALAAMSLDQALDFLDALPEEPAPSNEPWTARTTWNSVADTAGHLGDLLELGPDGFRCSRAAFDEAVAETRAKLDAALSIVPEDRREALIVALRVAGRQIRALQQEDSDIVEEITALVTKGVESKSRSYFRSQVETHRAEVEALRAHVEELRGRRTPRARAKRRGA